MIVPNGIWEFASNWQSSLGYFIGLLSCAEKRQRLVKYSSSIVSMLRFDVFPEEIGEVDLHGFDLVFVFELLADSIRVERHHHGQKADQDKVSVTARFAIAKPSLNFLKSTSKIMD